MTDSTPSVKRIIPLSDIAPSRYLLSDTCSDSVTKSDAAAAFAGNPLPSLVQLERYITGHCKFLREYSSYKTLLIELLWLIVDGNSHLLNAMDHIARQEAQEPNAWLRDD